MASCSLSVQGHTVYYSRKKEMADASSSSDDNSAIRFEGEKTSERE